MTGADDAEKAVRNATWIDGAHSRVQTGSGDQYNYSWYVVGSSERLVRGGTARRRIVRDHRLWLSRCFVPPGGLGEATERLAPPGAVVLLDGAAGIGLRTAATMLLQHLGETGSRFEELSATTEDGGLDAASGDRLLLDLSGLNETAYASAQQDLAVHRAAVEKCGARLVVVLPPGLDHLLDSELAPLVVRLERPSGALVFARYLRVFGIPFEPEELDGEPLRGLFERSPMRELARLAELVKRARESRSYGTVFRSWCDEAVAAVTDRAGEVARQIAAHRDPQQRALLLSAAMFTGVGADVVLQAAYLLLEVLAHNRDETPRLAQADLGEQLEVLRIQRDTTGRIAFAGLAYDSALRTHFWSNFPDLRDGLRDWAARAVQLPGLTAEDRLNLVSRFAEQSLAADRPDDLCRLIETWTAPAAVGRLRAEAATALEIGLSHYRHGGSFRSRSYVWATGQRLSPGLAGVLTDVCRQVLAVTHPDQALVRLRHLTLRQRYPAAREALLDLARADQRAYRKLTDRLIVSADQDAVSLVRDLLEPAALRMTPPSAALGLGWHAVLMVGPQDSWVPLVHQWLAAAHYERRWERGLNALLVGAAADNQLLNQLYAAALDWAASGPVEGRTARSVTAERFCQKIDSAQGVDIDGVDAPDSGART
ncbi:hypothetical protein ABZ832_18940 [Streptantibioticus parmotrematis]|uniref:hypothetical protein n=1 Tax=Streptantibioticus parmotrematis TaxID=2873249 RepID=UPI0033C9C5F6